MSAIHEQAMNYVYQQVLQRLLGYFSRAERTALQLLIQRLIVAAGGIEQIAHYKVLVAHGGGKDSSYTLAFLRAAQLSIAGRAPATFQLRVGTLRHSGVSDEVMANINRGYSALFMHDDPRVEVLLVENQEVQPFNALRPVSGAGRERNRRNMLMAGHLTAGDGRSTFCNDCYLSLGDFYERVASWKGGVHALVNGDSPKEQRQYLAWFMRTARAAGVPRHTGDRMEFEDLFKQVDEFSQDHYYHDVYGEHRQHRERRDKESHRSVSYLNIHDLVSGLARENPLLLTEFMGFCFADLAFHFTESDCANPLLMAHLRGLQAEYVRNVPYEFGIEEYLQLAKVLMARKHLSATLAERALAAYATPAQIQERRVLAAAYAQDVFGLNEAQLVCLLFSPFVKEGLGLEAFLRRCHPGMLVAMPELHKALLGKPVPELISAWLMDISGLPISLLQHLYRKEAVDFCTTTSLIARVRANDPDKCRVRVVDPRQSEPVIEVLSGR